MRVIVDAVAVGAAVFGALLSSACGDAGTPVESGVPTGRPPADTTPGTGTVQTQVGFVDRTLVDNGTTYRYKVFVPHAYTPTRTWPVILYLHGSGEVGVDNVKQTQVGIGLAVRAQEETFPAIVVFPQLNRLGEGQLDVFLRMGDVALANTMREFSVDTKRIYQTGVSLGALWGWGIALKHPTLYAAIVPIAGGICVACVAGQPVPRDSMPVYRSVAQQLITVPVWFIHSDADASDPVYATRMAVQAFKDVGAPVRYTEYRGLGHVGTWDTAYRSPDFLAWLLSQHR